MNTLVKYNGVASDLSDIVDRFHDCFWSDPVFQLNRNWRPTDVSETDKSVTVEIELPRFKKEEIKVEVDNKKLSVTAKNAKSSYVREFSYNGLDFEKADVKLQDGVLRIEVPKLSSDKSKKYLEIK